MSFSIRNWERIKVCFLDAGGRPGSRGPFVSAKGAKTIDAPSGFIEEEGRELFAERPNSPGSHKGRQMRRASLLGASRQASDQLSAG